MRARRPVEDGHNPNGADQDMPVVEEEYDEMVLCVLADTAKRILGKEARWIEKRVLGGANFSDDITVTHWDSDCECVLIVLVDGADGLHRYSQVLPIGL